MTATITTTTTLEDTRPITQLRTIAERAIEYRGSKGFAPTTWETLPHRLCKLYEEVGELREAIETQRREESFLSTWALRRELADCTLYATQMLEDLWPGEWLFRERYHGGRRKDASASDLVEPLRGHLDQVSNCFSRDDKKNAPIALELFLSALYDLRSRLVDGSLLVDCMSKIESMADRPVRHGRREEC